MMGRYKWVFCLALITAALALNASARRAMDAHDVSWRANVVRYDDVQGGDFAAVQTMRQQMAAQAEGKVAGWAQALDQKLSNAQSGATATADIIYLDGDSDMAIDPEMLSGQLPMKGNPDSCAIDSRTANLLFGATDIVGEWLRLAERAVQVCGVFRDVGVRGLMICPSGFAATDAKPSGIAFQMTEQYGKADEDRANALMAQYGFSGKAIDRDGEANLMHWLLTLAQAGGLLLLIWAVLYCARKLYPDHWIVALIYRTAIVLLCCGLLFYAPPPPSLLPTRWSDFSFWSGLIGQGQELASDLVLHGASRLRLMMLISMLNIAGLCLLSLIAILCAKGALKHMIDHEFEGGLGR